MKLKSITLSLHILALGLGLAYGGTPTQEGFDQLNKAFKHATKELTAVKSPEQLAAAMGKLKTLLQECQQNQKLKDILSLTPETCPENLKKAYQEALTLQADMKDAAKRLAMAGIMQGNDNSKDYMDFIQIIQLTGDNQTAQGQREGAPEETPEARDARMKWWRDGKFGMFIHYGLYSGLAGEMQGKKFNGCVEWIMQYSGADSDTYAKEALAKFNPKSGKAAEWVKLAKEAGCAYTVLTSRHHEGYNMFDTKFSDFNVKKTKGVDVVGEYAKACKKLGMKAGYYVSTIDWSHPDYDPTGSGISYPQGNFDAQKAGKRTFGNHEQYKKYLYNIFDELLTKYGPVDLVWWDFSQPNFQGDKAWGATALMKNLFDKNPKAIQNNRLFHSENHLSEGGIRVTPVEKGDYSTAEHHIPATGINGDWEACQTLNGTWGYSADNQKWKTSPELIKELVDTVSRGGNFLLNIGPMPDGSIPPESVRLFKEIGAWMKKNGEAIYGTRANPLNVELPWGRITRKGDNTTYIFVYQKPENGQITIPCTFDAPQAKALADGTKIKVSQDKEANTTTFDIKNLKEQPGASVIKVTGKRIVK